MKRFELGRLYRIYKKIKDGKYPNVSQLAKEEEVTERTIKKDIQTLKYTLCAPISYSKRNKGYFLSEEWNFPLNIFTFGEILTIFIANNLLKEFKETPLYKSAQTLSMKLEELLPEKIFLNSRDLEDMLSFTIKPIKLKRDILYIFEKVFNAIRDNKKIKILYYTISRDEKSERILEPYHIYNFEGVWYLVAFCHMRNSFRDFALDRIEKIEILKETFQRNKSFDVKDYLSKSFRIYKGGEELIKLKFDSYQAKWIKERIWHESQIIQELEDGGVILTIKANKEEIKRWILGYGSHVEVLEPDSFRKEIIDEINILEKIYKK
ncbi:MAG: WYL domain-containing protein [Spirochaetes bacterium]|nr:WYL domain-containing protein [Spirochaetota bacterium]